MHHTDRIEREAKFELAPDQQPSAFTETLAHNGYTVRPLGIVDLTDTYFDSPSYALLRHGLALRVRHGLAAYEVGIKSLESAETGASLARLDIAFPLPAGIDPFDATAWPAALFYELARFIDAKLNDKKSKDTKSKDTKSRVVKPKELHPVVIVRQSRVKSHIEPAASTPNAAWAAEWSQDDVWIDGNGSGQSTNGQDKHALTSKLAKTESAAALPLAHFRELEVELLPVRSPNARELPVDVAGGLEAEGAMTESAAFDLFVANVQSQFGLTPIYESKYVRGLSQRIACHHGSTQVILPKTMLADAGRLLLHQQLLQILLNEHGARAGKNASYVHDMRVAVRRARAAIHMSALALPADTVKPHAQGLKRLGRTLGAVRDLDVALANLRAFARRQPQSARHGFKQLRAELKARREDARAKMLAFLDSKQHRKFVTEFDRFCATPTPAHQDATEFNMPPVQVRHTVPSLIWAAFEAVRAYEVAFEGGGHPPLETLHALRIEAKYLRYLIEFTAHLLGRDGALLADELRALQEHLGELNDAHVEDARLHAWDTYIGDDKALHAAIASRRAELAGRIAELSQTVPYVDFVAPRNRRRLARALSSI